VPRGGKRRGAGRKKSGAHERSRAVADDIVATGRSPLAYMIAIMEDVTAAPARRDEMARAAAVYCHPRLSSITTSNVNYKGGDDIGIVQILTVPRGARVDLKDGSIVTIDGTAVELEPVAPHSGTPALELTDQRVQTAVCEPLPVQEIDTANVERLDAWRRRDDGSDGTA
jgi:hypothetical protein